MRTNIVLNDDLVQEAQRFAHAKTKRGLIEEALKTFVRVKQAEQRGETYGERVYQIDRRLSGLVLRESPHSVLRSDRERR